jgi:hypothetical protein
MKRRRLMFLVGILVLLWGIPLTAKGPATFNLTITDGDSGLLRWFEEVAIFTFDPVEKTLGEVAAATVKAPNDQLQFLLPAGHYQIMVKVSFLPDYVPFGRVEVLEGQKVVLDLQTVEFPDELVTF